MAGWIFYQYLRTCYTTRTEVVEFTYLEFILKERAPSSIAKKNQQSAQMQWFYLKIWSKMAHLCANVLFYQHCFFLHVNKESN